MKFSVTKDALLSGLQAVQSVVSTRSALPVLSNVLIKAEKNILWLTTTDLDVTVRCGIEVKTDEPGATTLPARRLSSIIRELPAGTVDIEVDEKDTASVKSSSSFFRIIGLSQDDFPLSPEPKGDFAYSIDQGVLKEMFRKTAYAASSDETRYVLNGVLICFKEGKLTMVATDGRRLALCEQEIEFPAEAECEVILPSKAVNELVHVLADDGEMKIHIKDNMISFEFGDTMVSSKLIDGNYPNYRQVIPSQCEERIPVDRESLLTALKRVSLVTTDKSNATKLTFANNQLVILMTTPDVGEARETVPIKYSGKEISVAFNPEYMMDPLRNLANDEIFVELQDELSPGVIKCDIPFLYVLMPMRLS